MKLFAQIKTITTVALGILCFQSCIKKYDNPAAGTPGESITLFALRQAYQGSEVTLNADATGGATKIQGIVISDKSGGNVDAGSFIIQQTILTSNAATDVTRGVILKMASGTPDYNIGDSVVVNISGLKMDRPNGRLTISGVTADRVQRPATGKTPLLRYVTQGILGVYMEQYESTLIALHADVTDYTAGTTFAGLRKLKDNTPGPEVYVHTLSGAGFAATSVPVNAQFTGIAEYYNENGSDTAGAKKTILPRNAGDIQFASGALYSGFPESFEQPDFSTKSSYNSGTNLITTPTGVWYLLQAILANTPVSDKYNVPGKQSIRMQQNLTTNGYVQMNFDVPDGASKVTVFYGKYSTDAKSSFRLEYSTNQGTTWTAIGANITDMPDKGNKQATWTMNITGPVRFRINKLGIGASNNGRLALDDFAIYRR